MLLFCYRIISVIRYHNAALYAMQALSEQFAAKRKKAPRPAVGERIFRSDHFAALAFSHRAVKAAGSWIAVSDSILRFMSMPASFRPCMKVE